MLQAELEGLLRDLLLCNTYVRLDTKEDELFSHLVDTFKPSIIFECFKSSTIALPEELEPRRNKGSIGTILALVAANCTHKNALRSLARFKIVDINKRDRFLRFLLRLCHLRVSKGDKALDHILNRPNRRVLGDILVLHHSFLRYTPLTQLDAQLDEVEHDRLEGRQRGLAESLGGEHFCEGLQGGGFAPDRDETLRLLQECLGLGEWRHDWMSVAFVSGCRRPAWRGVKGTLLLSASNRGLMRWFGRDASVSSEVVDDEGVDAVDAAATAAGADVCGRWAWVALTQGESLALMITAKKLRFEARDGLA